MVDRSGLTGKQRKKYRFKYIESDDLDKLKEVIQTYKIDTSILYKKDYGDIPVNVEGFCSGIEVFKLVNMSNTGLPLKEVIKIITEDLGFKGVLMYDYYRRLDRERRLSRRQSKYDGDVFKK